jgi:hypothetical protein
MNKTERRKALNRSFYEFVNTKFPQYDISDDGNGSCVTLSNTESKSYDDIIDYHRSQHYTVHLNWASEQVKADAKVMDEYIEQLLRQYDL